MAKPLMSPLLLENSTTKEDTPPPTQSFTNSLDIDSLHKLFFKPQKSAEIKRLDIISPIAGFESAISAGSNGSIAFRYSGSNASGMMTNSGIRHHGGTKLV